MQICVIFQNLLSVYKYKNQSIILCLFLNEWRKGKTNVLSTLLYDNKACDLSIKGWLQQVFYFFRLCRSYPCVVYCRMLQSIIHWKQISSALKEEKEKLKQCAKLTLKPVDIQSTAILFPIDHIKFLLERNLKKKFLLERN